MRRFNPRVLSLILRALSRRSSILRLDEIRFAPNDRRAWCDASTASNIVPIFSASSTLDIGVTSKVKSGNLGQCTNRGLNVTSDTRPRTDMVNAELCNHYDSSFRLRLHRQSIGRAGEFSLYGLADKPVLSTDRLLAQPVRLLVLRSLVNVKLHQLHSSLLDNAENLLQLPLLKIFE